MLLVAAVVENCEKNAELFYAKTTVPALIQAQLCCFDALMPNMHVI